MRGTMSCVHALFNGNISGTPLNRSADAMVLAQNDQGCAIEDPAMRGL